MATTEAPAPTLDPSNPKILRWEDIGLTLIYDFITEDEEKVMIEAFHAQDPQKEGKRRISQHFGYHFDYTTFGASETHLTPVPSYINNFLPRLPIQSYLPDQFTVQYYPPGSGIPPHVDTHSIAVAMQFRMSGPNDARKMRLPKRSVQAGTASSEPAPSPMVEHSQKADEERIPTWELVLPPRSLLLMAGASRYGYTHAIRPRKTDVIEGKTVQRQGRYSITMRTIRRGDEIGCDCDYPGVCDARIREEMAAQAGTDEEGSTQ
ncbi:hypothetical protein N0V88_002581 [Collariella sp. IMI 366227]|nr:hypothetical protein N0V88_002581 [Collariella sp. IMI 366227]